MVCWAASGIGTAVRADDALDKSLEARTKDPGKLVEHHESKGSDGQEGMKQILNAIREQAGRLQKEGKHEEADKLLRHAKEMMSKLASHGEPKGSDGQEGPKQKINAIREQAEQLRKQGRTEEAEKLIQHAKELMSKRRGAESVGRPDAADDVRGEVQQLQRELKEVREQVRHLQEQQRKQEERK